MNSPFPAYDGEGEYIFVCYAHEDSPVVFPELQRLHDTGINLYYDEGISPGREWTQELANAIDRCSRFLYLISRSSVASRHCRNEVQYALEQDKPIVSVHLEPTELPGGLKLSLGLSQAIMKSEMSSKDYRRKLGDALETSADPLPQAVHTGRHRLRSLLTAGLLSFGLLVGSAVLWLVGEPEDPTNTNATVADPPPSIAVLPFVNIGETPEYFSEGIAEEILNRMIRRPDLRVISRHSSFTYRNSSLDIREIAQQLGADYILQGSVRRSSDVIRIVVHLTDAAEGTELWGNSYDRAPADMLRTQDDIAHAAVNEFVPNITLTPSAQPIVDPVAYDLYLKARQVTSANDPITAKPLLQSATMIDPNFADAHAALADVYEALRIWPVQHFVGNEEIRRVVDRALLLDPENTEALAIRAKLQFYDHGDLAGAISEFETLLPRSSGTRIIHHYRPLLVAAGKLKESLVVAERRQELDPKSRVTAITSFFAHFALGQFEGAREAAGRLPLQPVSNDGWSGRRPWLIHVDIASGDFGAAQANLDMLSRDFNPEGKLYFELWLAIERGQLDTAREIYRANPISISAMPFMTWLPFDAALTGDITKTLDEIENPSHPRSIVWITMLQYRNQWIAEHGGTVFRDVFTALRNEPRYQRALQKYGIDDASVAKIQVRTEHLWR